jgi:hypothetical protein
MTVFELIEILSEVNPTARVTVLAGGLDAQVAEEVVAVATPQQVWVRRSVSDKAREIETQTASKRESDSHTAGESAESEPVSVVILSADEDFLFKAIVRNLMLG